MIELILNKNQNAKIVAEVENGNLVEVYEESEESQKARNEGNIFVPKGPVSITKRQIKAQILKLLSSPSWPQ